MSNKNNEPTPTIGRRRFIKNTVLSGIALGASFSARSYARIIGANDRIHLAIVGIRGRGKTIMNPLKYCKNVRVNTLCDVDSRLFPPVNKYFKGLFDYQAANIKDYRRVLESKDVDVMALCTPDHWHVPMTLDSFDAGKHVYLEKPCSHNPHEGEILIKAQKKYAHLRIQMGNQQRSARTTIAAIKDIREGIIGQAYYAKTWYANWRPSIGRGKKVAVPEGLDWALWQGPAPREDYRDNLLHYNWHWFWNWGSGEICNNGTHELDIARWALNVDYPSRVSSTGGRFHFDDDWEFYDTQNANFEFADGKAITWEGRSCNGLKQHERNRGTSIHGTEGSILLDRKGYQAFNQDGARIKEMTEAALNETTNSGGAINVYHIDNFLSAIRENTPLNSPIDEGHKSVLLSQLANIAQKTQSQLKINSKNGHILKNKKAKKMWRREYAKGWAPKL